MKVSSPEKKYDQRDEQGHKIVMIQPIDRYVMSKNLDETILNDQYSQIMKSRVPESLESEWQKDVDKFTVHSVSNHKSHPKLGSIHKKKQQISQTFEEDKSAKKLKSERFIIGILTSNDQIVDNLGYQSNGTPQIKTSNLVHQDARHQYSTQKNKLKDLLKSGNEQKRSDIYIENAYSAQIDSSLSVYNDNLLDSAKNQNMMDTSKEDSTKKTYLTTEPDSFPNNQLTNKSGNNSLSGLNTDIPELYMTTIKEVSGSNHELTQLFRAHRKKKFFLQSQTQFKLPTQTNQNPMNKQGNFQVQNNYSSHNRNSEFEKTQYLFKGNNIQQGGASSSYESSSLVQQKQVQNLETLKHHSKMNLYNKISLLDSGFPIKMQTQPDELLFKSNKLNPQMMDQPVKQSKNQAMVTSESRKKFLLSHSNSFNLKKDIGVSSTKSGGGIVMPKIKDILSQRNEVLEVERWINNSLQELNQQQNINLHQLFWREQKIFSASLGEIIRQVKMECQERGNLLKKIIDSMIQSNNQIFIFQTDEIKQQEKQYEEKIAKLQLNLSILEKNSQLEQNQLSKELSEKENLIQKIGTDNYLWRKLTRKSNRTIFALQNEMNEFRRIFNDLLQENIGISMQAQKDSNLRNEVATEMKVTLLEASKNNFQTPIELQQLLQKVIQNEEDKQRLHPGYKQAMLEKTLLKLLKITQAENDPDDSSQDELFPIFKIRKEQEEKVFLNQETHVDYEDLGARAEQQTDTDDLINCRDKYVQTKYTQKNNTTQTVAVGQETQQTQTFIKVSDKSTQDNIYQSLSQQNSPLQNYQSISGKKIDVKKFDKSVQVNVDSDHSLFGADSDYEGNQIPEENDEYEQQEAEQNNDLEEEYYQKVSQFSGNKDQQVDINSSDPSPSNTIFAGNSEKQINIPKENDSVKEDGEVQKEEGEVYSIIEPPQSDIKGDLKLDLTFTSAVEELQKNNLNIPEKESPTKKPKSKQSLDGTPKNKQAQLAPPQFTDEHIFEGRKQDVRAKTKIQVEKQPQKGRKQSIFASSTSIQQKPSESLKVLSTTQNKNPSPSNQSKRNISSTVTQNKSIINTNNDSNNKAQKSIINIGNKIASIMDKNLYDIEQEYRHENQASMEEIVQIRNKKIEKLNQMSEFLTEIDITGFKDDIQSIKQLERIVLRLSQEIDDILIPLDEDQNELSSQSQDIVLRNQEKILVICLKVIEKNITLNQLILDLNMEIEEKKLNIQQMCMIQDIEEMKMNEINSNFKLLKEASNKIYAEDIYSYPSSVTDLDTISSINVNANLAGGAADNDRNRGTLTLIPDQDEVPNSNLPKQQMRSMRKIPNVIPEQDDNFHSPYAGPIVGTQAAGEIKPDIKINNNQSDLIDDLSNMKLKREDSNRMSSINQQISSRVIKPMLNTTDSEQKLKNLLMDFLKSNQEKENKEEYIAHFFNFSVVNPTTLKSKSKFWDQAFTFIQDFINNSQNVLPIDMDASGPQILGMNDNPEYLLKTINSVMQDLILMEKKGEILANPLHVYLYDYFYQQFGLNTVAENKMEKFLQSLKRLYPTHPLFATFALLCGIIPEQGLSLDAQNLQFFFQCLTRLDISGRISQKKKLDIENMVYDESQLFDNASELIKNLPNKEKVFEFIQSEVQNDMRAPSQPVDQKKNLLSSQFDDRKKSVTKTYNLNISNNQSLKFHRITQILLNTYVQSLSGLRIQYLDIVMAIIPNQERNLISLSQYRLLLTTIENINNKVELSNMEISFLLFCNVKGQKVQENLMTFDCFINYIDEKQLFYPDKLQAFLEKNNYYEYKDVSVQSEKDVDTNLKIIWPLEYVRIKRRLLTLGNLNLNNQRMLQQIDIYFQKAVVDLKKDFILSPQAVLIAYQLLKQDIDNYYLADKLSDLIPFEFCAVNNIYVQLNHSNGLQLFEKVGYLNTNQTFFGY